MEEEKDIFDKIMSSKIFRPVYPIYIKRKEVFLYLFFGGLAFLINLGCYALASLVMHHLAANVIAWIAGVLFAYITNKTLVFGSHTNSIFGIIKELLTFSTGRLATLFLEECILWIGIDILGLDNIIIKILAQIVVTIVNYVISKWLVFKK